MSQPQDNQPAWSLSAILMRHLPRPGGTKARLGAVGITALVTGLSLMPNLSMPGAAPNHADLVIHLCMQASLGFALTWGWPQAMPLVVAVLGALVVGLEAGQIWVPGREFVLADLGMNAVGAGLGATFAGLLIRHMKHLAVLSRTK